MDTLFQDVRYAVRGLRRAPGLVAVAVATVALGIAATTVIFSLLNALLLRPLPLHEPDRLVAVEEIRRGGEIAQRMGQFAFRYDRYLAYREAADPVFSGLAAHLYRNMSLRTEGPARVVSGILASDNYFDVLGIQPAAGRFFSAEDRMAPVAVISHRLWREQFGGEGSVVGNIIHVDSRPLEIVGVAPEGFGGTIVGLGVDVWASLEGYEALAPEGAPEMRPWLLAFGRLRPQMEAEQASAALETVAQQIPTENPATVIETVRVSGLSGVPAFIRAGMSRFMGLLLATAGLVLLIASTNVGGLLLARAAARRREVAIRLALGGGRSRIVRLFLTESVLLFMLAGGAGVLLAVWLTDLLTAIPLPVQAQLDLDLGLDLPVLAFATGLSLVTGFLFGLAPAFQASRPDVVPALKNGEGNRATSRNRLRGAFVVGQLAMALLLLITAGLFGRTLQSAMAVDTGFDAENVVVGRIDLEAHGYDEESGRTFISRLLERLDARPEIETASLALFPPMSGNVERTTAQPAGDGAEIEETSVDYGVVGTGYFETLRVPLIAGRGFTESDRAGATPVTVVNQTLADRFWPGESPLGRQVRVAGDVLDVVGVVADGKYEGYRDEDVAYMYFPFAQNYSGYSTLHARVRGDAGAALGGIREEMAALDPDIALQEAEPLSSTIGFFLFPQRLAGILIGSFGVVGLLLAAIGIYGILAYHVTQRTREIGIRMALGARRPDVVRLVVRGGLTLVAAGVGLGLAGAYAFTRVLRSLLFGVTPTDPLTFTAVPLLLVAVALLASYLPARRATRVDPIVALRYE